MRDVPMQNRANPCKRGPMSPIQAFGPQADNQSPPFSGHNAYRSDPLLKDIAADMPRALRIDFETVGKFVASAEAQDLARIANRSVPELRTHDGFGNRIDQVDFHPYTDLLLHDMGPALDDGYTEGRALSSEWRTPPLWGIGLQASFQGGQAFYLHDGRARTLEEAIEWHGGEAENSRDLFIGLSVDDRARLIRFLESL